MTWPLCATLDTVNGVFLVGNVHMVVDEAYTTGIFGPRDRRVVAFLGLEDHVLAGLHV
jgi:8-amino-7-oxononanoate synthase